MCHIFLPMILAFQGHDLCKITCWAISRLLMNEALPSLTQGHKFCIAIVIFCRVACTIGHWAMDRDFFNEIGGLDPGMQLWGGENIDIAIRVILYLCMCANIQVYNSFIGSEKLSILAHTYPHKPFIRFHHADSPLHVWPDVGCGDLQA